MSYLFDGTRPVTQNHLGSNTSSFYLDVQGFSHRSGSTFDEFHNANPDKPMMATECCSCMSQRGEDADLTPDSQAAANASRPGLFYNNLIQECTASQVLDSDGRDFVAGTVRMPPQKDLMVATQFVCLHIYKHSPLFLLSIMSFSYPLLGPWQCSLCGTLGMNDWCNV